MCIVLKHKSKRDIKDVLFGILTQVRISAAMHILRSSYKRTNFYNQITYKVKIVHNKTHEAICQNNY